MFSISIYTIYTFQYIQHIEHFAKQKVINFSLIFGNKYFIRELKDPPTRFMLNVAPG